MPSADFYQLIPPPLDDSSTEANWQTSPGNAHPPSRLCPPHIRPCFPYRYWTLKICAFSSSTPASYAISVRRASALPAASFRSHLTVDTLAVRLTIPPVGFVENFHLQVGAPCRAHTKKRGGPEKPSPVGCVIADAALTMQISSCHYHGDGGVGSPNADTLGSDATAASHQAEPSPPCTIVW